MTTVPLARPISTYDDALAFLHGRINFERQAAVPYREAHFKLDRMRALMARLGWPDRQQRIIHIAGTKGKGSTAAMIASILTAAGYRTGLYTSPHLEHIEERLAVDARACSPAELTELIRALRPIVEAIDDEAIAGGDDSEGSELRGPTFFEITTAMALLHFANRQADATVLEVGLGGRLDSTNICQPELTMITTISYDHTEQLGKTLASIAREKAGIVKSGVPLVSGVQPPEPRDVIRQIAAERDAPMIELGHDYTFAYRPPRHLEIELELAAIDWEWRGGGSNNGRERALSDVKLALAGRHQAMNAANALAAVEVLRQRNWRIEDEAVRRGLLTVQCPARVEVVSRRPTVVVDVAHNVASVEALVAALDESFAAARRILIFASTRLKDHLGMLRLLVPRFEAIVLTRYVNNPRGVPPAELDAIAREVGASRRQICDDPIDAWRAARRMADEDSLICVTGSFFIAAEMRAILRSPGPSLESTD
jgi:dihydrofolate synthase/folylpolyglutamate synthase